MAAFEQWAEWYDRVHPGLPGEAEFYVGQAVRCGGPLLDIGCGTGRIALAAAMSGIDVVGLDDSEPMLDRFREKLGALGPLVEGDVELVNADMRSFDLGRRFPLAVMAYRTFMHLLEPEDQLECLATIRRHLEPDGVLALNLWAARPGLIARHGGVDGGSLQLVARHCFEDDTSLVHYRAVCFDELAQRIDEEHLLHEVDEQGRLLGTSALRLVRSWLSIREMGWLVAQAGFEVQALFGDFDCNPLSEDTQEMIWVLRPV